MKTTMDNKQDWNDKAHPNITAYWNSLKTSWYEEYQKTKKDYVKEFFIKLVSDNVYRFLRSYNKRMKHDIESVDGLSDIMFHREDVHPVPLGDVFFIDNGFRLRNLSYECRDDHLNPYFREGDICKYFSTSSHGYFDKLDECKEFCINRSFEYNICDSGRLSYGSGNPILSELKIHDDRLYIYEIIKQIRIKLASYTDVTHQNKLVQFIMLYVCGTYFKIIYREDSVDTNDAKSLFIVPSFNGGRGEHSDIYHMCDSYARTVHIKSNIPLFNDEQCRFFHLMEKLNCYDQLFLKKYSESFDSDPMNQFIDQLFLKYAIIENSAINSVLEYMNTIKDRNYHYNHNTDERPIARFLKWLYPSTRERYDRYSKNTEYKMEIVDQFPPWLDLRYRSIVEAIINLRDYGQVVNESFDREEDRLNRQNQSITIDEMIDTANLRREKYFMELKEKYIH